MRRYVHLNALANACRTGVGCRHAVVHYCRVAFEYPGFGVVEGRDGMRNVRVFCLHRRVSDNSWQLFVEHN